jgi:hypothetical protein
VDHRGLPRAVVPVEDHLIPLDNHVPHRLQGLDLNKREVMCQLFKKPWGSSKGIWICLSELDYAVPQPGFRPEAFRQGLLD